MALFAIIFLEILINNCYVRKSVDTKRIKIFGKRVAELRKRRNLTQEELADLSNLSLSQVARIETGAINTTLNTIFLLTEALRVTSSELLDAPGL
jgi:transcriptional regulator with XRE-family HTH domain